MIMGNVSYSRERLIITHQWDGLMGYCGTTGGHASRFSTKRSRLVERGVEIILLTNITGT